MILSDNHLVYEERPIADIAYVQGMRCKWLSIAGRDTGPVRIMPDGCMDLLWNGRELLVAGPDTGATLHHMAPGSHVIGVRFAPGHGARFCAAPADALRDARVPLAGLWEHDAVAALRDRLLAASDPQHALEVLVQATVEHPASPCDPLVQAVVARVNGDAIMPKRIAALACELGVSERQLLRRCKTQLGYGPKFLARVLRFQRFLTALRAAPQRGLSELTAAFGYADQAHLGHDVSELAGTTPGRLKEEALRAMSDSYKTAKPLMSQTARHADLQR